ARTSRRCGRRAPRRPFHEGRRMSEPIKEAAPASTGAKETGSQTGSAHEPISSDGRGRSGDTVCTTCGVQLLDCDHAEWCPDRVRSAAEGLPDRLLSVVTGFVVWPSDAAARAFVLWIAATHVQPSWEHASRFVLKSPIKRCGKTRAQEIGRELVANPLATTN